MNDIHVYEKYTDEQLAGMAAGGDELAIELIFRRYTPTIRSKSNMYFLMGGDKDDLIQEGMIGLFWAITGYRTDGGASFRTFAETCIGNQMIAAVKRAGRKKHAPLNDSVSIDESLSTGIAGGKDPEEALLIRDEIERIERISLDLFSKLEYAVWGLFKDGCTYREIALRLNKSPKSVDNAIQRIKKKVGQIV